MTLRLAPDDGTLTVFYDASCPVCSLEMDHLAARDRCGRLDLVDISAPAFDAAHHGFAHADLDAAMHVRDAAGRVSRGVPALRLAYGAVGLGWLVRPTAWPWLAPAFDAAYRGFAAHRHTLSRRLGPAIRALRRIRDPLRGRP